MPRINRLLETAIYVADLQVAANFYRRLFEFETLVDAERLVAFDVAGKNVLLLFKAGDTREPLVTAGGVIPGHDGQGEYHFAFAIDDIDLPYWRMRLDDQGVAIESVVTWEAGGQSIYFRDPDRNLVELLTPGVWRTY